MAVVKLPPVYESLADLSKKKPCQMFKSVHPMVFGSEMSGESPTRDHPWGRERWNRSRGSNADVGDRGKSSSTAVGGGSRDLLMLLRADFWGLRMILARI